MVIIMIIIIAMSAPLNSTWWGWDTGVQRERRGSRRWPPWSPAGCRPGGCSPSRRATTPWSQERSMRMNSWMWRYERRSNTCFWRRCPRDALPALRRSNQTRAGSGNEIYNMEVLIIVFEIVTADGKKRSAHLFITSFLALLSRVRAQCIGSQVTWYSSSAPWAFSGYQSSRHAANICEQLSAGECFRVPDNMADKDRRDTPEALSPDDRALFQTKDQRPDK